MVIGITVIYRVLDGYAGCAQSSDNECSLWAFEQGDNAFLKMFLKVGVWRSMHYSTVQQQAQLELLV